MRLSAFSVVDAYEGSNESGRLDEIVQLAVAAEEGGLSGLWVAEHHFFPWGTCPSPPVLLAACGARTSRIRLGALVSVLPFHSAIEAAEQYAMVDRLTGGRLNLGVGSGYIPSEFEGFGIDPAAKRPMFDERLDTLRRAFAGEEVRNPGPTAAPVRLNVRPVQVPCPPIWVAVQRREAVPHVARMRASLALIPYATVADLDELTSEIREYRAALPPDFRGEVLAAVHVYAGPHPDRARAALQRYLDSRRATHGSFYEARVERDPRQGHAPVIEAAGWAIFGTPADVAARLDHFAVAGIDELVGIFDFGGLPIDEVLGSVRSLGRAWSGRGDRPAGPG